MDEVQKHLVIEGRVQGVGFRHFTRKTALDIGVGGWVRNMVDGRVEALIRGPEDRVDEMIRRLQEGPASARVESMEFIDDGDLSAPESHPAFEIRP